MSVNILYLIKWHGPSGLTLCTEQTKEDALRFMLDRCEDPNPVVWAFSHALTEELRAEVEDIKKRREKERRARLVRVKCPKCKGTGDGDRITAVCQQCHGPGYLELERWEP